MFPYIEYICANKVKFGQGDNGEQVDYFKKPTRHKKVATKSVNKMDWMSNFWNKNEGKSGFSFDSAF